MLPFLLLSPLLVLGQVLYHCPKPQAIQSEFVRKSFEMEKFAPVNGSKLYYEIAYKDLTQPRICNCITADKKFSPSTNQVLDSFTIECAGAPWHSNLVFNSTGQNGVFVGIWNQPGIPILSRLRFPDTVVDVGVNPQDGSYDWTVEFQCIEGPRGLVLFYAFNFYSTTNDLTFFDPMMKSFRNAGLGRFVDGGLPLQMVNHTNCWYEKKSKL
jgi:hypothetical protein